jgi:hypothetical protein
LPPHGEDDDDENLCVVCLDAPREAGRVSTLSDEGFA